MKSGRQDRILEIIRDNEVHTQQDLAARLRSEGFDVTQATVSRDMKRAESYKDGLRAGRLPLRRSGRSPSGGAGQVCTGYLQAPCLRCAVPTILSCLRTMEGSANTVAVVIDGLNNDDILGCIAGDDTMLIVVSGNDKTAEIIGLIEELRGQAEV